MAAVQPAPMRIARAVRGNLIVSAWDTFGKLQGHAVTAEESRRLHRRYAALAAVIATYDERLAALKRKDAE